MLAADIAAAIHPYPYQKFRDKRFNAMEFSTQVCHICLTGEMNSEVKLDFLSLYDNNYCYETWEWYSTALANSYGNYRIGQSFSLRSALAAMW